MRGKLALIIIVFVAAISVISIVTFLVWKQKDIPVQFNVKPDASAITNLEEDWKEYSADLSIVSPRYEKRKISFKYPKSWGDVSVSEESDNFFRRAKRC